MKKTIRLGYAPTRRSIFSAPDAVKYRNLTADRLREMGVDFVDIDDINAEGLLYSEDDRLRILEKFKAEKVDGLLLAHCNFGTEYLCARLAKELGVPVLLWGPLDERPEPNGVRLRDTQCGLFATGKVLRRFGVPFTYLTNCRLSDPVFERGVRDFLAVCNVVRTFRHIRILQIGPRPFDFWSTMCNEGELAEGSVWEGAMAAGHYGLSNLCAVVDRNGLQISGTTEAVMRQESQSDRWKSFGWNVLSAAGNDTAALKAAFDAAKQCTDKPTVILAETVKGCGVSFMENQVGWHHRVPSETEYAAAAAELEEKRKEAERCE